MKTLKLMLAAMLAITSQAYSQTNQGGLPLSLVLKDIEPSTTINSYPTPDWDAYLEEERGSAGKNMLRKGNKVGLHVETDFSFPESGSLRTLTDGSRVWRGSIRIEDAPAIGLLFDRFVLPKGVSLFLTNENQKQVVGAFTAANNTPSGKFAVDAVEGAVVTLELNIDRAVNLDEISLHVNKALVFYRAIEHLKKFRVSNAIPIDVYDGQLNGGSSVCMVNAMCPEGSGYENNRKATVQLLDLTTMGACSGTLINNTGNTVANCKPYILTATHCQEAGSMNNASFDQMMIRFNFERPDCEGLGATNGTTILGANLLSRANYYDTISDVDMVGDFMLLEMREAIPASLGAVLSGWNKSNDIPTTETLPRKFIGFHHPHADNKKLSTSQSIQSVDHINLLPEVNGNRWGTKTEVGYIFGGSSGSGLFDGDGKLIGIASIALASATPAACKVSANGIDTTNVYEEVYYDKLWHAWDFAANGDSAARKLKPWLDPANTGALTLESVTSACTAINSTSVNERNTSLANNIAVFPNPATDGLTYIKYNFKAPTDLTVEVYDITGKLKFKTEIKGAPNGQSAIALQNLADGIYVMKVSSEAGYTTQKLVVGRK